MPMLQVSLYANVASITLSGENADLLLADLINELQDAIDWPRQDKLNQSITKCEYAFVGNNKQSGKMSEICDRIGSTKTSMLCVKSTTCSPQLPEYLTVRNSQEQKQTIAKASGLCTPFKDGKDDVSEVERGSFYANY